MVGDLSYRSRRPALVTAASRCQLAAAALLAVAAVGSGIDGFLDRRLPAAPGTGFTVAVLLVLAAWVAVAARGLREGHRWAYRSSLLTIALVLLTVIATSVFDPTTEYAVFDYTPLEDPAGAIARAELRARWRPFSDLIVDLATTAVPALLLATAALLATPSARHFFRVPHRTPSL